MAEHPAGDAILSKCGRYRYALTRSADGPHEPGAQSAVFCMLNPSTADASVDDPTIRRCRGFAREWGCDGLFVVNLYALRATNPKDLWKADDPVGPCNDSTLRGVAKNVRRIVCAWGTNAKPDRVRAALDLWACTPVELVCLGVTRAGHPRHPLYVRADQPLQPWSPNV